MDQRNFEFGVGQMNVGWTWLSDRWTFTLFRNRRAASLHRSAAPTNDSVSLGWALVMTHRHSSVNDMFSRVSNSARGLQLFLRLFSGDGCSRVYGKSELG